MTANATNVMLVKTPEGVAFALPLASPITRMLAWSVDLLVILAAGIAFNIAIGFVSILAGDLAMAMRILGWFAISIGYGIALEWRWRGQTCGKRLLRLRVVDAQGLRLQFNQIVIRNLLRFVDSLPAFYLVGGTVSALSQRCQRLGDIAANTVVIRIPKVAEPDLAQMMSGKFNSLRKYPHLVARLRQRVSPAEAAVALQAVQRREEFGPAERVELFAELARHFARLAPFPADAVEGVTDEQYVRNTVEVLYRTEPRDNGKPVV
jgi:uncharacterized RDD family membrane protein YckC